MEILVPSVRKGVALNRVFFNLFQSRLCSIFASLHLFLLNRFCLILGNEGDYVIGFHFRHNGFIFAFNHKNRKVIVAALQIAPRIIRFLSIGAVQEPSKLRPLYVLNRSVMVARKSIRISIADHIVNTIAYSPICYCIKLAKRDRNVGSIDGIVMIHRLNLVTLVQHHFTDQVTHLLFIGCTGIALGRSHRDFAYAKGIAHLHSDFVCAGSAHQATHHESVARMLATHGNFAHDTDLVDEGNFVTDAAQATHIRFLLVRGSYGASFFRLVRNQVIGADHDVFKLYRFAAFGLGKATQYAAHKHIV